MGTRTFANGQGRGQGPQHHLFRCANGDVWAWGSNATGQLAEDPNALPDQLTPKPIANLTDIIATAVSAETSYALQSNGILLGWGGNSRGELGIGFTGSPMWIFWRPNNLTHVVAVAAGDHHVVALRDDGTVWAWGANDQGQLGDGTTNDSADPVPVIDRATGRPLIHIQSVASAGDHTLATGGGRVYSWGSNGSGELGTGSGAAFEPLAEQVTGWPNLAGAIAVGAFHCLILNGSGDIYSWGDNSQGQLGDGSGANQPLPVRVPGLLSGKEAIANRYLACTRYSSLLGLRYGLGDTYVWGDNTNGELGICGPAQEPMPVRGHRFASSVLPVGEGTVFRATDQSGSVFTWGGPEYVGYSPSPFAQTPSGGSCQPTALEICQGAPTQPLQCIQAVQQNAGATYDAANHLGPGAAPTDIGYYGVTTTIDANTFGYGGRVIFDGQYRVRGTVRLINGNFEMRPGTIFYVDGLSGQTLPSTISDPYYDRSTFVRVKQATLLMRGARMLASCDRAWGGLQLRNNGRLRTEMDAATELRCGFSDAFFAVDASIYDFTNGNAPNACEYYLNQTDFIDNLQGIRDWFRRGAARAGEGVHYCTFTTAFPTVKFPFNHETADAAGVRHYDYRFGFAGISFFPQDDNPTSVSSDYAAASVDHNTFHHLNHGILGSARNLHVSDNSFDYVNTGIYVPGLTFHVGGIFAPDPMYLENNFIVLRGTHPYFAGLTGIYGNAYVHGNRISGSDLNPAAHTQTQVGIEVNEVDGTTQSDNFLENLNVGVAVNLPTTQPWGTGDVSGNLFRGCSQGMRFGSSLYYGFGAPGALRLRCNTFQNPGRLPGSVGLYIASGTSQFPGALGSNGDPNGNKFGVAGVLEPNFTPILNNSARYFNYFRYSSSVEEIFPVNQPTTFGVQRVGGTPATACTNYSTGIQNRAAPATLPLSPAAIQQVRDSLWLAGLPASRRSVLLGALADATPPADYARLESALATLPDPQGVVHASLGLWLVQAYRANQQEADALHLLTTLRRTHDTDPHFRHFANLFEVTPRVRRALLRPGQVAAADLATLRTVAQSATNPAWTACRLLQQLEPQCKCRFATEEATATDAQRRPAITGSTVLAILSAPYPNPAHDALHVPYALATEAPARLEVRDILGRVLRTQTLPGRTGTALLAVGELPTGLYLLVLVQDGHPAATHRIAIAH